MAKRESIDSVAYCGLVCGICTHAQKKCPGCHSGGGDGDCQQRLCCVEKGLDGCWQCESFPCEKGYFVDAVWKGLCIGFVRCIQEMGIEKFVDRVESIMGTVVDYGDYRFKSDEEIRVLLTDTET